MNYINTPCSLNSIKGALETDGHVMGTMVIFPSQCRNLGSESLSYLPKLTHLVSGSQDLGSGSPVPESILLSTTRYALELTNKQL